jgi:Flp pilus assembly protein TadD
MTKKKDALLLLQEGRLMEAAALYTAVTQADPLDVEAWFRLGTLYWELGVIDDAEACFLRVMALEPKLAIVHSNLGKSTALKVSWIRRNYATGSRCDLSLIAPLLTAISALCS